MIDHVTEVFSRTFSRCRYSIVRIIGSYLVVLEVLMREGRRWESSPNERQMKAFVSPKAFHRVVFTSSCSACLSCPHLLLLQQMSTTVENGMGGFSNTSREKTYKKVCTKTTTKSEIEQTSHCS